MRALDFLFSLLRLLWSLLCRIFSSVFGGGVGGSSGSGRRISFDDGRAVVVGRQIAEGGFSFVFEARDADSSGGGGGRRLYALKRINCADADIVDQCRKEAGVHRTFDHENLMPLLGMKFESSTSSSSHSAGSGRRSRAGGGGPETCYMLFPYIPISLRADLTARRLLDDDATESQRRPYSQREALTLFSGIVDAVRAMHDADLSHRDVKVENVLLKDDSGTTRRGRGIMTPVLMDFGSAGPLAVPLRSRSDVLRLAEEAAQHTTLPYRAPELFDGGVRHGPSESLDYGRSDVWSLGCVLFALLYGSSPFEVEWRADGTVRIVDCTHLKVLGPVPFPPGGTAANGRYGEDAKDLLRWMLNQARGERPSSADVAERVGRLIGGGGVASGSKGRTKKGRAVGDESDPFDSIVTRQSSAV